MKDAAGSAWNYNSITNCPTKIPAIFHRIFGILSGISKHTSNY